MRARLLSCITLPFAATLLAGCNLAIQYPNTTAAITHVVVVDHASLLFPDTTLFYNIVDPLPAARTVTLFNTGTGVLSLTGMAFSGTNAAFFTDTTTCSQWLAVGATCKVTFKFSPTASGPASAVFSITDDAADSPQTVALTGTASAVPATEFTACEVALGQRCTPTFSANGELDRDPSAAGKFHGYADPTLRKDPNSSILYMAYSWPYTLPDGTQDVDLHLASSTTGGDSFTYIGPLSQSGQSYQTFSTETVDLMPIPLAGANTGQTLWVQAHQSHLVKGFLPKPGVDEVALSSIISVSALQVSPGGPPNALLSLGFLGSPAPGEARLGAASTDPSFRVTQLANLSPAAAKCAYWSQPALWYQSPNLYLALECNETSGNVDAHQLSHFVYTTLPTGSDASAWTWAYVGEFLTGADAAQVGNAAHEHEPYQFFTQPKFIQTRTGQLAVLATPGSFDLTVTPQAIRGKGCRVLPITLSPTAVALMMDPVSIAPVMIASVEDLDAASAGGAGAACTYEPASDNGIIMGLKFANDPVLGNYIYPLNTFIAP